METPKDQRVKSLLKRLKPQYQKELAEKIRNSGWNPYEERRKIAKFVINLASTKPDAFITDGTEREA